MFCSKFVIAGALGIASLTATVAPASAAIISQTQSIGMQISNWSYSLVFNKFNPALGTLTAVNFTLDGAIQGTIFVENKSKKAAVVTSNLSAQITLTRPDTTQIVVALPPAVPFIDALAKYDLVTNYAGPSGVTHSGIFSQQTVSHTSPLPNSDLVDFTGLGTISLPITATATSFISGPGTMSAGVTTEASADVTVEYVYNSNSVPEPTSLALFGSGLIALGAFTRRRKNYLAK